MNGIERIRLAFRTLPGWQTLLSVAGIAAAVVCLTIGGRGYAEILKEKSQPCEVKGTMAANNEALEKIRNLEEVLSVSRIEETEGVLLFDDYQSQVRLIGVDAGYLNGEWQMGEAYPNETAMPYVVLNEAAVKGFQDKKKARIPEDKQPDWLSYSFQLEGLKTELRVCGILKDGAEDARAYLSLSQWMGIQGGGKEEEEALTFWIRLKKEGVKGQAVKNLTSLGMQMTDQGEAQDAEWSVRIERQVLYLGVGTFAFLWSLLLFGYQLRLGAVQRNQTEHVLVWMGLHLKRKVIFWQWGIVVLLGGAIGFGAGWLLGA